MTRTPRLARSKGQWRILMDPAHPHHSNASPLDLGGVTSRKVAVRLWCALQTPEGHS